ncbi:unnamed protein product, partial [marine sediment metagenome]
MPYYWHEYETYNYYIPNIAIYPPTMYTTTEWTKHYTRGISTLISGGPWSFPDTTIYSRVFRYFSNAGGHWKTITNADSVTVTFPEGNYQISRFRGGYRWYNVDPYPPHDTTWDKTKGLNYYGVLDSTNFYDNNDEVLKRKISGTDATQKITSDSIPIIKKQRINDGAKTYETRYYEYDNYGNAHLIHECGDTAIATDDRWIHREYA